MPKTLPLFGPNFGLMRDWARGLKQGSAAPTFKQTIRPSSMVVPQERDCLLLPLKKASRKLLLTHFIIFLLETGQCTRLLPFPHFPQKGQPRVSMTSFLVPDTNLQGLSTNPKFPGLSKCIVRWGLGSRPQHCRVLRQCEEQSPSLNRSCFHSKTGSPKQTNKNKFFQGKRAQEVCGRFGVDLRNSLESCPAQVGRDPWQSSTGLRAKKSLYRFAAKGLAPHDLLHRHYLLCHPVEASSGCFCDWPSRMMSPPWAPIVTHIRLSLPQPVHQGLQGRQHGSGSVTVVPPGLDWRRLLQPHWLLPRGSTATAGGLVPGQRESGQVAKYPELPSSDFSF